MLNRLSWFNQTSMGLPFLSEEGGGSSKGGESKAAGESKSKGEDKTFTQADKDRDIQSAVEKALKKRDTDHATAMEVQKSEAEVKRLTDEGKFEELHNKAQIELNTLREQNIKSEFLLDAKKIFKEKGLHDFEDILLGDLSKIEGLISATDTLTELINSKVEEAVKGKLDTGKRTSSGNGSGNGAGSTKKASEMNDKEKMAFIKEHGSEAYTKKLDADS